MASRSFPDSFWPHRTRRASSTSRGASRRRRGPPSATWATRCGSGRSGTGGPAPSARSSSGRTAPSWAGPIRGAARTPSAGSRLARTAADWIRRLGLSPHPEGGHYRETYRSARASRRGITCRRASAAPAACPPRSTSCSTGAACSRLHRIKSDEVWHFYDGAPLDAPRDRAGRALDEVVMGRDVAAGRGVPGRRPGGRLVRRRPGRSRRPTRWWAARWRRASTSPTSSSAGAARLLAEFPRHRAVIERLTPPD